jgi:hypothetical protein
VMMYRFAILHLATSPPLRAVAMQPC